MVMISFSSSSVVTGVQFSKVGVGLDGTSYDGVVMVDARTESTLSLKMQQNHLLCERRIAMLSGSAALHSVFDWTVQH